MTSGSSDTPNPPKPPLDPMTKYLAGVVAVAAFLSVLGFVLAFTVDPNAINMGIGAGLGALILGGILVMLINIDRMG